MTQNVCSGDNVGFSRCSAARNRVVNTTSPLVSRDSVPCGPKISSRADTEDGDKVMRVAYDGRRWMKKFFDG
jgi:hypothetical protein